MSPSAPALVVLAAGRAKRYGGVKPLAPIGPGGEAVVDLLVDDATRAGFERIVLVIGAATGPSIRYHVEHRWPRALTVAFAEQSVPRGTVDAVVTALPELDAAAPFAVCNADDLYGEGAFSVLVEHLTSGEATNALVGFTLANAVIGDAPVTRGVCQVDAHGELLAIDERRQVQPLDEGRFAAKDGKEPSELPGDAIVSVNLWGFRPETARRMAAAMEAATNASEENEVLLPEFVAGLLAERSEDSPAASRFSVLHAPGRCIGVTHPEDLKLVQAEVALDVGLGARPGHLWSAVRAH